MPFHLRPYTPADAEPVDRIALAAFQQDQHHYDNWPDFARRIAALSTLADAAEIIVATVSGQVAGAVAYVAPGQPKAAFFEPEWAVLNPVKGARLDLVQPRQ